MLQEYLLHEMLNEMRVCIKKEDLKAGLPDKSNTPYDIEHIFILWQQLSNNVAKLKKYISNLDDDIAARVPWGDISISSEEGFKENLPITTFWTAPKDCFAANETLWTQLYNAKVSSVGDYLCYFTTVTPIDTEINMEGAEQSHVCPSPASTLIMLQTRAKDSLKHAELKLYDFAVAHYRDVETSLGLKDTIPTTKRKRLLNKLKKIFHR